MFPYAFEFEMQAFAQQCLWEAELAEYDTEDLRAAAALANRVREEEEEPEWPRPTAPLMPAPQYWSMVR